MTVASVIDDALFLLGEDPAFCLPEDGGEGRDFSLRGRLRVEVEGCAARALAETAPECLTGWQLLPDDGFAITEDGRGILPLPGDFLLLHTLRLSGWKDGVRKIYHPGHWLRSRQDEKDWPLRGSPARPLLFYGIDHEGKRCLEVFGVSEGDTVAEGWYMPAPTINEDGRIDIPPAAYRKCLDLMVSAVRGTT